MKRPYTLLPLLILSATLGTAAAYAQDETDELDIDLTVMEADDAAEAAVDTISLPDAASDQARESAAFGLETANNARQRGEETSDEASERGEEQAAAAREKASERAGEAIDDARENVKNDVARDVLDNLPGDIRDNLPNVPANPGDAANNRP